MDEINQSATNNFSDQNDKSVANLLPSEIKHEMSFPVEQHRRTVTKQKSSLRSV